MAKQVIDEIRMAEKEAQQISDAIPVRVKAVLDDAERRGQMIRDAAARDAESETGEQLCRLRDRAENLLTRHRAEAEDETDRLREDVRQRMPDAVKMIVWGIMAKCQ